MKINKFWILLAAVVLCCLLWVSGNSKASSIGTDLNDTRWGLSANIGGLASTAVVYEFYDSLDSGSGKVHYTVSAAGYYITSEYGNFTVNTAKQIIRYSSDERTQDLAYELTNGHISGLAIVKDDGSLGAALRRIR